MSKAASDKNSAPVALVTGGSRGLGAGIVRELSAAGLDVAVNFRSDRGAAEALLAELDRPAERAYQADVADPAEADELVAAVVRDRGRLDALVVSAGIWRGGRAEDLAVADWSAVLQTNLSGAFHVVRAALPQMREQRFGRIVLIGSIIGIAGYPGDSAYAAAKSGLVGFAKSVAQESARAGVTVNVVAPGFIETDMTKDVSATSRERLLSRVAMRTPGRVEDVAKAVRFLVQDAPFVTGQVLAVDGGFS